MPHHPADPPRKRSRVGGVPQMDPSAESSVFHQAYEEYPSLACLTHAELIRMAELLRGVNSSGDLTQEEAHRMVQPWRHTRTRPLQRGQEVMETSPQLTPCPEARLPQRNPLPGEGPNLLGLTGCGVADGEYRKGLYTYARADGAVLVPVSNGWSVYSKPQFDGQQLLASCSEHDSSLEPWAMDGWVEPDQHGLLICNRSPVRVQIGGVHNESQKWTSDVRPLVQQVRVRAPGDNDLPNLDVAVSEGTGLLVGGVLLGSLWESLGFERGMRILSVTTAGGDDVEGCSMIDFFRNTGPTGGAMNHVGEGFVVEVQSPWVWDAASAPSATRISQNGRSIAKLCGQQPSFAVSGAPGIANTWRVLLEGNVQGARVGLCRPNMDVRMTEADTESAYWYLCEGVLRHGARDVARASPCKSGDVITVTHSPQQQCISFMLNGVVMGELTFTDGDVKGLHPCVCLKERGCTATICNGTPTAEVLQWDAARIDSKAISITNGGRTISIKKAGAIAAAVGSTVFRGPGPHKFQVSLNVTRHAPVHIGVVPPGVDLKQRVREVCSTSSFFGMTVLHNTSVYNLQEPECWTAVTRQDASAGPTLYEFTINLGDGTITVMCNGEYIVYTARLRGFPRAEGPLVPYVFFDGTSPGTEVTLLEARAMHASPEVEIRGARDAKSGTADGIYKRHTPTYIRQDGRFQVFHWNRRWCVADPSDRPVAFSSAVDPKLDLGSSSLKWTTVRGFQAVPEAVRVVTPVQPGGILNKQGGMRGGKVWYANRSHVLFWSKAVQRWVITDTDTKAQDDTASSVHAYYSSPNPAELPHCCTAWLWGNGSSWCSDMRLRIAPCCREVPLKRNPRPLCWSEAEFGAGWDAGAADAGVSGEELRPAVDIETHIHPLHSAPASGIEADMMTSDELAGCHIIRKACGKWVKAPDLRRALAKAAEGADSGIELRADWSALQLGQLQRIGVLLHEVNSGTADPRVIHSFDEKAPRYGEVLGQTIEGAIVDTSRMPVADRKLFGLSLLEEDMRTNHVLDCTEDTPKEDVAAFVSLFQHLEKGRMVVLNLQALHLRPRGLIRTCIEDNRSTEKEMLAVVTGDGAADMTLKNVATMCDMSWKKWAMQRAAARNKFKSITYYAQGSGTGKSFAIEAEIAKGTWGNGATATRLDLDSTTVSLCEVCQRLMAPLRRPEGVLLVHVGHDTKPSLVNQVLDSLIFLGRIQSNSGLSASLPPNGWHLVVEFQQVPEREVGHVVNVPWVRPDGASEITILACQGLAKQGKLSEYNLNHHRSAAVLLRFLRKHVPTTQHVEDGTLVRMLALGMNKAPAFGPEEDSSFNPSLEPPTARFITRALKYAFSKLCKLVSVGDVEWPLSVVFDQWIGVVAEGIIHGMGHFVAPEQDDHCHVSVRSVSSALVPESMILSGKLPADLKTALDKMGQRYWDYMDAANSGRQAPRSRDAGESSLLNLLCDELVVRPGPAFLCLRDKSCVLMPDFLQKLIQLSTHIDVNDPAILQGPPGTGKSYAIMVLSELLQLPTHPQDTPQRAGFRDLPGAVENLILQAGLFSDTESDRLFSGPQLFRPRQNLLDCLEKLVENDCFEGVKYARECLLECIGQCVGEACLPDVAKSIRKCNRPPLDAAFFELASRPTASIEHIGGHMRRVVEDLHIISSGISPAVLRQMEACLSSERMRDLVGPVHDDLTKLLSRSPMHERMQNWARTTVPLVKGDPERFCRQVKGMLRDEISKSPILKVAPDLLAELADTHSCGADTKAMGESLAKILSRVVGLQREPTALFIPMGSDMTHQTLFDRMLPALKRATECPRIRFVIAMEGMDTTGMLGLVKRIVVDRYWWKWEDACPHMQGRIPDNIAFVGSVSSKGSQLEGPSEGGPQRVTPMPPSLMSHAVPWHQLAGQQLDLFVLRLVKRSLFSADLRPNHIQGLSRLLLAAHKFAQVWMQQDERPTPAVSQHDIHRTMKVFGLFFKKSLKVSLDGKSVANVWERSLSAMLLGIAVIYDSRFPPDGCAQFSDCLTGVLGLLAKESKDPNIITVEADRGNIPALAEGVSFASIVACNPKLIREGHQHMQASAS